MYLTFLVKKKKHVHCTRKKDINHIRNYYEFISMYLNGNEQNDKN